MFAYLKQKSSTTPMSPLHVSEHNLTLPLHTAESDSFLSGLQSNSAVVTENVFNSSRLVTKSWRPAQLRENSSKSSAESLSSCTDCSRVETDNVFASPSCFSGKKIVQCELLVLYFITCFCCWWVFGLFLTTCIYLNRYFPSKENIG